jgi:NADH-quinone oxidoreductase subunit L
MVASILAAFAGIGLAIQLYRRHPEIPGRLATSFALPYRVLYNKYYVDEIYGRVFVRGAAIGGGNALHAVDRYVIDGAGGEVRAGLGVNGIAWAVRDLVGRVSNFFDRWFVDGAVNLTAVVLDSGSYVLRALQNGLVQHYALAMLIGVFFVIAAGRFLFHL